MNYDEMSDFEINKAVAANAGMGRVFNRSIPSKDLVDCYGSSGTHYGSVDYCNNPADAWPIIVENGISLSSLDDYNDENGEYHISGKWQALGVIHEGGYHFYNSEWVDSVNENPLRAAMIAYLMMQEDL